jgi:recombinational DNA repair protein RecT
VIIDLQAGGRVAKIMSRKEIMAIGEKFSKSYKSGFSPWNPQQDPELWMWKKTVLKQAAKLVPKNESIYKAIAEDNKDSEIENGKDRFGGLELPKPKALVEKEAAKDDHAHEIPAHKPAEEEPQEAEVEHAEGDVTYEATNDAMPCSKCGQGMSSTDVDFCDNAGIPHTCADCRRKDEKPKTTAQDVIAKRKDLKNQQ